jgi:hypothetical protein
MAFPNPLWGSYQETLGCPGDHISKLPQLPFQGPVFSTSMWHWPAPTSDCLYALSSRGMGHALSDFTWHGLAPATRARQPRRTPWLLVWSGNFMLSEPLVRPSWGFPRDSCLGFRALGLGYRASGLAFRASGLGFRVCLCASRRPWLASPNRIGCS